MLNYDTLLQKDYKYDAQISDCFVRCWDEIVALQTAMELDSALLIDAALTDEALFSILRNNADKYDLWSLVNIQAVGEDDVLTYYRRIEHGSLNILRLFSRISSRGVVDYKRALEMDATTDDEHNLKNAKVTATKPIMEQSLMEPFVMAFLAGLETEQEVDRTLFYHATVLPQAYGHVIWWMVAMLCREDWSVWDNNIKPHLRDLINTWDGGGPSIPTDVTLVTRLEAIVAYIAEHQQQENRLVTGNNDKQEALSIYTESAAPRYRPEVDAEVEDNTH